MHRIDTNGALPGGQFTDGNPAIGQQGTIMDAAWLNDMQENVAQAIEHAGIALVKGDGGQLTQAIVAIVAGVVGSGGGAVPTTRKVLGGGLVTGGGTLDQDETLTVTAASAAEALAGVDNTKAVTPAALGGAFSGQLGAAGWSKLPSGLIFQWGGVAAYATEGQVAANFPIAFPNACDRLVLTPINATASANRDIWVQIVSKNAAGFVGMYQRSTASDGSSIDGLDFFAIGH